MLGPHTPPVLISPLSSPLPGNARETSRFVATLLSVSLTRPQKHYLRAEKWRERADFEEFQGISRGAPELWEREGFIAVERLTNSRLVMVTVLFIEPVIREIRWR